MGLIFGELPSDSPLVETVWHSQSDEVIPFISQAINHWEIVIWQHEGKRLVTVRGPETKASPAASHKDAQYLGIQFKLGTYMPHLPTFERVDGQVLLPEASSRKVWLNGSAWPIPDLEDVDVFVARLVWQGLLQRDPVVRAVLEGQPQELSSRTLRRRFLHTIGVTPKTHQQIERARQASHLLEQGTPIPDVVFQTGFADQPHLTRSLKHFLGKTPALILDPKEPDPNPGPYRVRNHT